MPSPHERHRNNIRVGVFVSVALILGMAVIFSLTDFVSALTRPTHEYAVDFDISAGVADLSGGSDVRVGGVVMGQVVDVEPNFETPDVLRKIRVRFEIRSNVTLYNDATIMISAPLIGGGAWLAVPDVGNKSAGEPPDRILQGTAATGMLTSILGSENAAKTDEMIENTRQFTEFLAEAPQKYDRDLKPTLDNLKEASTDVRGLAADIRYDSWPRWSESIDHVMTWANGVTDRLDAAIADGHGLLTDARDVLAENRPSIRTITRNTEDATGDVREMAARLNDEVVDKVVRLLDTGQEGLDDAVAIIRRIRQDYEGWSTALDETLANAMLTSQQLKLTAVEVRRSPWKLLYRPEATELEHELLYEAARTFALAVSDLKASSLTVGRLLDRHGDTLTPEQAQRLRDSLFDRIDVYERAQNQLLDILMSKAPE